MTTINLLEIVKDFIACSKYMCNALIDYYEIHDVTLLRARRINQIPKEGTLPDGTYFNFHGLGCYFEFETGGLDMDFGPDGRCDGFDLYRIINFIKLSKLPKYQAITDMELIKTQYENLIKEGSIKCPNGLPEHSLFYLSEALNI